MALGQAHSQPPLPRRVVVVRIKERQGEQGCPLGRQVVASEYMNPFALEYLPPPVSLSAGGNKRVYLIARPIESGP